MIHKTYALILLIILLSACGESNNQKAVVTPPTPQPTSHLKYFGFTLIDTDWDDPTDNKAKTNYADEVYKFSNLADILVTNPHDDLSQRVTRFTELNMQAVLHLNSLFFAAVDKNSPSGTNYDLRADFKTRWQTFKTNNQTILSASHIGAFYIGEEPTFNGISFNELNTVTNLVKADFPAIPTMLIEASPAVTHLQIPENIDWIGFDHYFIKNPTTHDEFQQRWQLLKAKRSHSSQKIMVIMDTHYISWAHGTYGNLDLNDMGEVANNYYQLAKSDSDVIGILGYFWPNGFDTPESIGAKGMPQQVLDEYKRIGKIITGK